MQFARSTATLALAFAVLAGCANNGAAGDVSGSPQPTVLSCFPDLDGQIDSSEFPSLVGFSASYSVTPNATAPGSDPPWHLDFSTSADHVINVSGETLGNQWYASSFGCLAGDGGPWPPCPDVALLDDPDNDLVEILARGNDGTVWLYGLTSQKTLTQGGTLLVYDQPIAFLVFPLGPGLSWTATATFKNGTYVGVPDQSGTQTYQMHVASEGELFLPSVQFSQALAIDKTITTTFSSEGISATAHQVQWLSECSGELARYTSQPSATGALESTLRRVVFP